MSERYNAGSETTVTKEDVEVKILDSSFGGSPVELTTTGSGWLTDTLQNLNPRQPLENPIQKRTVKARVWVETSDYDESSLITDLFSAEEGRFTLELYKGGTLEWTGTILPDLCEYDERDIPYSLLVVAKDFSILEGDEYTLATGRETIKDVLVDLLPYSLSLKTHTSWVVDGEVSTDDFLRQVYIDKFGLRTYARTGDESDEAITKYEALERVCKAYGLIVKQEGGVWVADQITAYDSPTSVLEAVYNSVGTLQSEANVDKSSTATVTIESISKHNPGIKSARVKYEHRTSVSNITFPNTLDLNEDSGVFTQTFISDGTQKIRVSGTVEATLSDGASGSGTAQIRINPEGYWWDGDSWEASLQNIPVTLTLIGPDGSGGFVYTGSFTIFTTLPVPTDADGTLEIEFRNAFSDTATNVQTIYRNLNLEIINSVAQENSTYIDYELTQTGNLSARIDYGDIFFGDGPTGYSRGATTTDSAGNNLTIDDWARRDDGATPTYIPHAHVLLREPLDVQRTSTQRISAVVKSGLNFGEIVSYDSKYYYILGGTFDGFTGVSSLELLRINIQTGTDTFEDLPKFTADEATGSANSGGSGGATGVTLTEGDSRWLQISNNLSDLDSASTAINNLGITATATELNILDGATLSTAELNLLDGVTATTVELNQLDGNVFTDINIGATGYGFDSSGNVIALTAEIINGLSSATRPVGSELWVESSGDVRIAIGTPNTSRAGLTFVDPEGSASEFLYYHDSNQFEFRIGGLVASLSSTIFDLDTQLLVNSKGVNKVADFSSADQFAQIFLSDNTTTDGELFRRDGDILGIYSGGTRAISVSAGGALTVVNTITSTTSNRNFIFNAVTGQKADTVYQENSTNKAFVGYDPASSHFRIYNYATTESIDMKDSGGTVMTGDLTAEANLFVEGGLFAKEFTVDTTRVMLSRRFGSGGIVGEITDATVGSEKVKFVDQDGNAITPFADNDLVLIQIRTGADSGTIVKKIKRKVVADSQPSNVVSLTTTGVTTGTDVGTIEVGDDAVLDGNTTNTARDSFIAVDVLDRDIAAFGFFDSQTDFGNGTEVMRVGGMEPGGAAEYDASLTGKVGIAGKIGGSLAFALTESEGLIGAFNFDDSALWSGASAKASATLRLDASNQRIRIGSDNTQEANLSGAGIYGANWYIDNNNWVHPSLGEVIYTPFTRADYDASSTDATDPTANSWAITVTQTTSGVNATDSRIILKDRVRLREGVNTFSMSVPARVGGSTDSKIGKIYLRYGGQVADSGNFSNTTYSLKEIDLDVSALTSDTFYDLEVEIEITGGGSTVPETATVTARSDLYIMTQIT